MVRAGAGPARDMTAGTKGRDGKWRRYEKTPVRYIVRSALPNVLISALPLRRHSFARSHLHNRIGQRYAFHVHEPGTDVFGSTIRRPLAPPAMTAHNDYAGRTLGFTTAAADSCVHCASASYPLYVCAIYRKSFMHDGPTAHFNNLSRCRPPHKAGRRRCIARAPV